MSNELPCFKASCVFALAVLFCAAGPVAAVAVELAGGGKAKCVVVIGQEASWLEKHAAAEFVKYLGKMTGAAPAIAAGDALGQGLTRVLIGTYQNHAAIRQLRNKGKIAWRIEQRKAGDKESLVVTALDDGKTLVLTGNTRRAVLWAVYDFLERECGVGFFFEGDYVPTHKSLAARVRSRRQGPGFPVTFSTIVSTGTNWHYSNWWRRRQEWQHAIDWHAKKKLQGLYAFYGKIPGYATSRAKRLEFGTVIATGPLFQAREDFRAKHPNDRYVKHQWLDSPVKYVLHHDDPLFASATSEQIRGLAKTHGKISLFVYTAFNEQVIHDMSLAEARAFLAANCVKVAEIVRKELPGTAFVLDSWAFHDKRYWDFATIKTAFAGFPADMVTGVLGFASNCSNEFYKLYHYYYGKPWIFSEYSTDGPNNGMKEDLAWLGWRISTLYKMPKDRCNLMGVAISSETNDRTHVVHEYVAKLAFSPEMQLDAFLRYYARNRYGQSSSATMYRFWKHMSYGPFGVQARINDRFIDSNHGLQALRRPDKREPNHLFAANRRHLRDQQAMIIIPHMVRAMEIGLTEADRQKDNHLYKRDMLETMLHLLLEIYNQHHTRVEEAYAAGDRAAFAESVRRAETTLDLAETLLASVFNWPDFCLAARWKASKSNEGEQRTKSEGTRWMTGYRSKAGKPYIDRNRHYWKLATYESMRDMYGPWHKAYFTYLRGMMAQGSREMPEINKKQQARAIAELGYTKEALEGFGYHAYGGGTMGTLEDVLAAIAMKFAKKPLELDKVGELRSGDPVPAIRRIFSRIRSDRLAEFKDLR